MRNKISKNKLLLIAACLYAFAICAQIARAETAEKCFNDSFNYTCRADFEKAIRCLSDLIEAEPQNALAYNNRGLAYAYVKENAKAIADFDKAISLSGKTASFYNNRGNVYAGEGDFTRAISDFNKATELDSKSTAAYNNRGLVYLRMGQPEDAEADFANAIKIDPADMSVHNSLGLLFLNKNEPEKAIFEFDKIISQRPDYGEAYVNRAVAYFLSGQYAKSQEDVLKAKKLGHAASPEFLDKLNAALKP